MNIRSAENKDTDRILELLSQVLEIHAAIRPDLFITGTTKYTREELSAMYREETRRIWVAVDDEDRVLGYAFCEIREPSPRLNMVPHRQLYIDDLCVDETIRGKHIGRALFDHARAEAAALGCYEICLNVWEGNDTARTFYDRIGFRPKSTTMEYIIEE